MLFTDYRFKNVADEILLSEVYEPTKHLRHHDESVYEHCLKVAYYSYLIAYKRNLDWKACIRGALLHDFYLYEFEKKLHVGFLADVFKHAVNHPKLAYINSIKYFEIDDKEKNIIEGHMFPFGLPKSKEAWIVSFVDKYIAIIEYSCRAGKALVKTKTRLKARLVFKK